MTEGWTEQARRDGVMARLEGKPINSNPYPKPGFLCEVWERGWLSEDKALRTPYPWPDGK